MTYDDFSEFSFFFFLYIRFRFMTCVGTRVLGSLFACHVVLYSIQDHIVVSVSRSCTAHQPTLHARTPRESGWGRITSAHAYTRVGRAARAHLNVNPLLF